MMNNIYKIITACLFIAGIALNESCVKGKFDQPPLNIPHADMTANISIAGLKATYNSSALDTIKNNYIIKGIVVATDESGNLYKQMVIQDTSGGIDIELDQADLYTTYRLGQRVYIKCQGLYLGTYGGLIELGYNNSGSFGRIPSAYINQYLFPDSLPGAAPIPITLSFPQLNSSKYDMLVKLDSVYFTDTTGQTFSGSRNLYDFHANPPVVVYTSSYANFANTAIPGGWGNVTGIFSVYGGSKQMTIRDIHDLSNWH